MNDPIPEALSNAVNALVDNRETWARAALDAIKPDPPRGLRAGASNPLF